MKVRASWGMTNSDYVLEQEITLNCENTNELIEEFKKEIFKPTQTNTEVHRECHVVEFSEKERFSKFYNELLLCLGEISYFEISIEDELKKHLTVEQLNHIENAYLWGLNDLHEQDIHLKDKLLMSLSIYDSLIVPLSDFGFEIQDNEDGTYKFEDRKSNMEFLLCTKTKVIQVEQSENWHKGILKTLLETSNNTEYSVLFNWLDDKLESCLSEINS